MSKKGVMVSIDEDIHEKARDAQINISAVTETALKHKLNSVNVDIPKEDGEKCHKCGKIEAKATREHLNGLTWLCPDEIWICDSCLKKEIRKVIIAV